jgi:hypothetical protein
MKMHIRRLLFFVLLGYSFLDPSTAYSQKIKVVKKLPVVYEYPLEVMPRFSGPSVEKPWIVYSDRSNNVTYTTSKMRTTLKTIGFMESFYVTNEKGDLLEIIKYAPDLLESVNKIKAPSKVQYYGWIPKSKLLLSQKSFVESIDKRPLKSVTMLKGNKFVDKIKAYVEIDRIKLYDGPELNTPMNGFLYFDELVYVYKTYDSKVLIGKKPHFSCDSCSNTIQGWVSSSFVQSWGQRICLEPLNDQVNKTSAPLIYPAKEWALSGTNTAAGYALDVPSCAKAYNWKKHPVFKIETVENNKVKYKFVHTGAITSTFDKTESFIYSLSGSKINYSKFCELSKSNKNINVVLAINTGSDIKEYMFEYTNMIQELDSYFNKNQSDLQYHFAVTDCSLNPIKKEFSNDFSSIQRDIREITQKSIENKNAAITSGIGNGLANASAMFKGHEEETNIIILISSKTDTDTRPMMKDALYANLASKNVRLFFVQPYCGMGEIYSSLITHCNSILINTANKIAVLKRDKIANTVYSTDNARTKGTPFGQASVSALDFPAHSCTQGFLLFPTVGYKIDGKMVTTCLDSLFDQIAADNLMMTTSLQRVFNSTSFNTSVNKTFQRYYSTQETLPADYLGFTLNYADYNYFINGYTSYPESMRPFRLSLLLSTEEYEDMYNMFKSLKLEQLSDPSDMKGRTAVHSEFSRLLTNYNKEHYLSIPSSNLTFSDYFYRLFGFYTDNELLTKYKVYDFNSPNIINKDDLKKMIEHMNSRINAFYKLRGDKRNMFSSNGSQYYWISEDYLP